MSPTPPPLDRPTPAPAAPPATPGRARPWLLGVDGGGTHTRAVLADAGGRVLGRGEAGSSNQATAGSGSAGDGLVAAVRSALGAAGVVAAEVDGACFGLAGLDRPSDEAAFRPAVAALGLGGATLLVNDAVNAWAGAGEGRPGIAVNAGTGSVAYGRDGAGREARVGGWGAPLGDEGSAYWIACRALARVLRGVDGRETPSALAAPLARRCGFSDPADLCLLARADRAAAGVPLEAVLAALAPTVVAAADEGLAEAAAILEAAAGELAAHAWAVAAALGAAPASLPVFGLGSVLLPAAGGGPTPVGRRLDALLRARTGAGLRPPACSALVGALVLAWGAAQPGRPVPAGLVTDWGRPA